MIGELFNSICDEATGNAGNRRILSGLFRQAGTRAEIGAWGTMAATAASMSAPAPAAPGFF